MHFQGVIYVYKLKHCPHKLSREKSAHTLLLFYIGADSSMSKLVKTWPTIQLSKYDSQKCSNSPKKVISVPSSPCSPYRHMIHRNVQIIQKIKNHLHSFMSMLPLSSFQPDSALLGVNMIHSEATDSSAELSLSSHLVSPPINLSPVLIKRPSHSATLRNGRHICWEHSSALSWLPAPCLQMFQRLSRLQGNC